MAHIVSNVKITMQATGKFLQDSPFSLIPDPLVAV